MLPVVIYRGQFYFNGVTMPEKTVSIGFTNEEFSEIQANAQKENVSISQYIKSKVISNETSFKYEELLQKVKKLNSGDEFTIKKLWEPDEWDNIPKGVKLSIGKYFYKNVKSEKVDNVIIKGFGKAGIMCYKKQ
jgi:hypothetical protein